MCSAYLRKRGSLRRSLRLSGESSSWLYTFIFTLKTLSLNKFMFFCNYICKHPWVLSFQFPEEVGLIDDVYMVGHMCWSQTGFNLDTNLPKERKKKSDLTAESIANNCLTVPKTALLAMHEPVTVSVGKEELLAARLHPWVAGGIRGCRRKGG